MRASRPLRSLHPYEKDNNMGTHVNREVLKKQTTQEKSQSNSAFEPFSWVRGNLQGRDTKMLGMAKDIAGGVALALQMIERSNLDREHGDAILRVTECGTLERFAISACLLLEDAIQEHFDWIGDNAAGGE